ncbi:hypothetical protein B0H11DRAFT_1992652 [Mycena galericulata]|nr:hypothetical protein B0H11DRAFT_1992652 [Mycena galericulata]
MAQKSSSVSTTATADRLGRTRGAARATSAPPTGQLAPAAPATTGTLPAVVEAPAAVTNAAATGTAAATTSDVNTASKPVEDTAAGGATTPAPANTSGAATAGGARSTNTPAPTVTTTTSGTTDATAANNAASAGDTAPTPPAQNAAPVTPVQNAAPATPARPTPHSAPISTTPAVTRTSASTNATSRRDEFPPLPPSSPDVMDTRYRAKEKKKDKGKAKAKAPPRVPPQPDRHYDDLGDLSSEDEQATDIDLADAITRIATPRYGASNTDGFDEAETYRAVAASLGQRTDTDNGASSSRRPAAAPGSPPKRQRTNTAGDAAASTAAGQARARTPVREHPAPRVFVAAAARYRTANGLPPRISYLPQPANGFRAIFGVDSGNIFRNLPQTHREMWDEVRHPKFLAVVAGGIGDRIQTATRIQAAIAGFVNADPASVQVGPPGANEGRGPDANIWLIGGLPIDLAEAALDLQMLCCTEITLFFFPYRPPITGFIGTFAGFTFPNNAGGRDRALDTISNAITGNMLIAEYIRAHRDALHEEVEAEEALRLVVESIDARPIELLSPAGPFIAWNVYISSPTLIVDDFNSLCTLIRALVIYTPFNGVGRAYHQMVCHICGAADHPTNLCPFPDIPGWMGPTPATIGALEEASREANRASSGSTRGGGNGRGRGGARGGNNRGKGRGGRGRGF